jgi:membrane fusion protein (multidrug efflux system)
MVKRMIIMLVIVGILLGGIIGFEAYRPIMIRGFIEKAPVPHQTVSTVKAGSADWQSDQKAVGSLRAVNGADLSLEVAGIVDQIAFSSGDDVAAGAVLLRLKEADDLAKLHSLQATADLARITFERDQKQLKAQAISQATLDTDAGNLKNALALVDEQQADLDKKTLRAPFAGHLGLRAVDLGQYLAAGTTIVTLQALDPLYVDFSLPQQALAEVKVGQEVAALVDAYPTSRFSGAIVAIDPKIDTASRNVQVRALLKNPAHLLLPGMFATVRITTGTVQHLVTLPQTAIAFNTYGDLVYLVEDKGPDAKGQPQLVARQAIVTTGPRRGDQVAILAGVKEGDVVVSAGQLKLRNGSPLTIDNTIQPTDDPNPHPIEQ